MDSNKLKLKKKEQRQGRIRAKVSGTAAKPRLSVFRSNRDLFLQLIDDTKGVTLVSASGSELKKKDKKVSQSFQLGKILAEKALAKNIKQVVFDRGGNRYHGRIKAVAEGAREGGLEF